MFIRVCLRRGHGVIVVWVLICCLLSLAGCNGVITLPTSDVSVREVVWLPDGWIYYLRQANSDASWEIWRKRPNDMDGSLFVTPTLRGCGNNVMVVTIFSVRDIALGAGISCGDSRDVSLVEYASNGSVAATLGTYPDVMSVTWRGGFSKEYLGQGGTAGCMAVTPIRHGALQDFSNPISVDGQTWVPSAAHHPLCQNKGWARYPTATKDGKSVLFLASANPALKSPVGYNVPWTLLRWNEADAQLDIVRSGLIDALDVVLAPDDKSVAVLVHEKGRRMVSGETLILLVNLGTGAEHAIGKSLEVGWMDFSPDGHQMVVGTFSGDIKIIPVP